MPPADGNSRWPYLRQQGLVLRSATVTGNHNTGSSGYPREWAAYHECGHAIAYWNLGLPFECITLSTPPRVQPLQGGTVLTVAEK